MAFIVPAYLWKRAELLGHKKHYFWGWIGFVAQKTSMTARPPPQTDLCHSHRLRLSELGKAV